MGNSKGYSPIKKSIYPELSSQEFSYYDVDWNKTTGFYNVQLIDGENHLTFSGGKITVNSPGLWNLQINCNFAPDGVTNGINLAYLRGYTGSPPVPIIQIVSQFDFGNSTGGRIESGSVSCFLSERTNGLDPYSIYFSGPSTSTMFVALTKIMNEY